ncbi:MAG: CHASE3 domain-containing protein [Timaviella obliquedivisa GSE-PSE-MK23-08B]|jgi:signal transduction histidine kinase|nr:CHASE3 domain-containing protein [Timaviella obliquedivisa GSE-PSE-MK23-08B]
MSLRRRGVLVITVPVICLLLFLGTSVYLRYSMMVATRYIIHTQDVLLESSNLLILLLNAETGARGYRSTREEEFLEPYTNAMQSLPTSISNLKKLVRNNSKQTQQVLVIEQKIRQELELLSEGINRSGALTPTAESSSPKSALLTREKEIMDQLRLDISQFQLEERRSLEIRQQLLNQQEELRGWVQLVMIAISILASLAAIYLFDRIEKSRQLGIRKLQAQSQNVAQLNQILAQTNMMLADRNQELDQFVYVSSHDLKAPLRAIANLSEWIEEDLDGQLPEEGQRHMQLLRKRVQRMDALINGLLEYSRVGRDKVSVESVNVAELLTEVIDLLAPPPNFVIEVAPMPIIQTRRLSLSQVFSNLLSNAIKHCDRLDAKIQITVDVRDQLCEFTVADNGPGIAPQHQKKIFTIFQTLDARDKTENTGIGLSIVKKLVELEGGKVWVESQPGEGAKFIFTWHTASVP